MQETEEYAPRLAKLVVLEPERIELHVSTLRIQEGKVEDVEEETHQLYPVGQ